MKKSMILGQLCLWLSGALILASSAFSAISPDRPQLLNQFLTNQANSPLTPKLTQEQRVENILPSLLNGNNRFLLYLLLSDTSSVWATDHWNANRRSTNTYDGNWITLAVEQDSSAAGWRNSNRIAFGRDGSNRLTSFLVQDWDTSGAVWKNVDSTNYYYTATIYADSTVNQGWDGGKWVNALKSISSYSGGYLETVISQDWDTTGHAWNNLEQMLYTYDPGGNQISLLTQLWSGSWVDLTSTNSTYDANNHLTQSITQLLFPGPATTTAKINNTYDVDGKLTISRDSSWGGFPVPSLAGVSADTFKYTGNNNTQTVHNIVLPTPSLSRSNYAYDANGNRIEDVSQDWSGSAWVNDRRTANVFQAGLAVKIQNVDLPKTFDISQNYPNPFNPSTTIRYSLQRTSQVEIAVFNLLGEKVRTLEEGEQRPGEYLTTWDGTDQQGKSVASGVYFYRIKAGDFTDTRKMVLMK